MIPSGSELAIVLLFSLIGGLVALRFRQPVVIGLLIAGALIGPNAFGLVSQSELINTFAELGAIFLLFSIGVHFSVSKLLRIGVRAIVVAALKLAFVFIITYEAALLLGMDLFSAFVLGAILSVTSTALVAKMIKDMHVTRKIEANIMIATLIIEDVYAVFLLTLFSSMKVPGETLQYQELLIPLISALVILTIAYIVIGRILKSLLKWVLKHRNEEALVLVALVLAVGFSYAASALGLEPAIGAFIGGSMAAALPGGRVIEQSILPFTAAFSSIFFLSMGMLVDPASFLALLPLIIVFSALNIVAKFFGMGISMYLTGMTGRQAVFAGVGMISVGEFSLLLARDAAPLVAFDLIGFTSAIVVITAISYSLIAGREEGVYQFVVRNLPYNVRMSLAYFSHYFRSVIRSFEPGGKSFRTFIREGGDVLLNASAVIAIVGAVILLIPYAERATALPAGYLLLGAALLISMKPIMGALESLKEILDDFSDAFMHMGKRKSQVKLNERLMKDAVLFMFFFLLSMNFPLILTLLRLQSLWPLSYIALAFSMLVLWDMSRVLRVLFVGTDVKFE